MATNQDNSGGGDLGCSIFIFIVLIILVFGFGFEIPFFFFIISFSQIINALVNREVSAPTSAPTSEPTSAPTSAPSPSPSPPPDDLNNILMDLSKGEIKDPVTQEIFRPGEKVYLCHVHRLGYHEDSWQEMGCKCMVCGNNAHTKEYTVPQSMQQPIDFPKQEPEILLEEIEFRDIK